MEKNYLFFLYKLKVSLICEKEVTQLKEIEILVNKKLELITTDGFEYAPHITLTNRKTKKEKKKSGVNLKLAKQMAEKMLGNDSPSQKGTQNQKKPGGQKPTNKRHF